eukprot:TRINITY_DN5489_c0_g1_i1.p1 TRINITY_DN5489_c0_g1~~TRINITY_DN5489_c0_g1_i1.p1  ORF type:complete len:1058 (-),score=201.19 TRINITY_DN5489_c0_g1_i1:134-3307(-)
MSRHAMDEDEDDAICHVCGSGDVEDGDEILFCEDKDCNVAVHQSCYGIATVPKGEWKCSPCAAGLVGAKKPRCVLCPLRSGAFKPTDHHHWAHVMCGMWVPETFIGSTKTMEPVCGCRAIPPSRRKLVCSVCATVGKAPIQCAMKNCYKAFHPLCGREQGWVLAIADSGTAVGFCDLHSSAQFQRKRAAILNDDADTDQPKEKKGKARFEANASMRHDLQLAMATRSKFVLQHWDLFTPFISREADRARDGPLAQRLHSATRELAATATGDQTRQAQVVAQPKLVVGGQLRDYQIEGLKWLVAQHDRGSGSILGDEMGLGKTLQVISFLAFLYHERNQRGPHLILAPLSVMSTWTSELQTWCPSMRVVAFHGPQHERDRIKEECMGYDQFDICVSTYEMLLAEETFLHSRFHWRYVVLDEAQRIKNEKSLIGVSVRKLHAVNRLLLTGTPLQNNLHELWALLNFLYPDVLPESHVFDTAFQIQSSEKQAVNNTQLLTAAHALLQPLMLRRLKRDVLKGLPSKTEHTLYVPLSEMQRFFYKKLLESNSAVINGAESSARFSKLNNLLMQLRKCVNHPFLLASTAAEQAALGEDLIGSSGKMVVLDKLLTRLRKEGHKCLIYSQFTIMLDLLEEFCIVRGYKHLRLDGSTAVARRRYELSLFSKPDSAHFVYLVSTKAGAVGLNLQAADTVIMFDSDWNPQNDRQAQDRVHRIGQKRPVNVYRLIAKGTCEERILHFAKSKQLLGELVLQDDGEDIAPSASLSLGRVASLVRYGVDRVTTIHSITDASIDALLQSSLKYAASVESAQAAADARDLKYTADASAADESNAALDYRRFEGVKYQREESFHDLAEQWVRELSDGHKREAKSVVVQVVTGEKGLGSVPVLRWSIEEAKKEAAAAAAVRPIKEVKLRKHESICMLCSQSKPKSQREDDKLMACKRCPRSAHIYCCGFQEQPRMGWQCHQHYCCSCGRNAADAGGLLFRCTSCPKAYCEQCMSDGFEAVESYEPFEKLDFTLSRNYEYIHCPQCVLQVALKKPSAAAAMDEEDVPVRGSKRVRAV